MLNQNKLKFIVMFIVTTLCCEISAKTSQIQNDSIALRSSFKIGSALTEKEFGKLTNGFKQKVVNVDYDFCVGIMNDDESIKAIENIQYRVFKNKYALEQIIFKGNVENILVNVWGSNFGKDTTGKQIKALKAEIMQDKDKGIITDYFNKKNYVYTEMYILRKLDQDDLVYAYFNAGKLIALSYTVQC